MAQVLRHLPQVTDPRALVGAFTRDDAAVYRTSPDRAIVATVDFFTPIVDDGRAFGAIAAANAFSDLYAMGAQPLFALNLVAWPRDPEMLELLGEAMRGAADVAARAGALILGGHSIDDPEPKLGMVAIGEVHPDAVITNAGARVGDRLVLTKRLGTGILSTALKRELIREEFMEVAITSMRTLNADAAGCMRRAGDALHAATDVTGFGLLGHLHNMLVASAVAARVFAARVPMFEGVLSLIDAGAVPGGTERNVAAAAAYASWSAGVSNTLRTALADAQTSGGLLMAVASTAAASLLADLHAIDVEASEVGEICDGVPGTIAIEHDD